MKTWLRYMIRLLQAIRSLLHISRNIPFEKVVRSADEDARGIRPVNVQFERHVVSKKQD